MPIEMLNETMWVTTAYFFFPGGGTYFLYVFLPLLALMGLVQLFLKTTYGHYSRVGNRAGITGAEAAQRILSSSGIYDVRVEEVSGFLSDHYDPREKVLRLSPQNYEGTSIAAVGVAAHEAGHALQHAQQYAPLVLRNLAVPAASIGSTMGWIVLVIGLVFYKPLALVGLGLVACIAVFQLINLPVEFDASRRALQLLPSTGILAGEEVGGARKVLMAAALTYVAALIAAIWQLLYYAWLLGLIGGRRD